MRESAEGAGLVTSAATYGDEGKKSVTRGVKEGGRRILIIGLQDGTQKNTGSARTTDTMEYREKNVSGQSPIAID